MKRKLIIGGLFLALILFLAFSPRQSVVATDVMNTFQGSSPEHWLGTDNLGRDVYSLIVEGGLRTLTVVFLASGISFIAGTILGMTAALAGGWVKSGIQFLADFTLIVPSFISALVFSGLFGFGPVMAGIVFGVGNMGEYVNLAQGLTEGLIGREYIANQVVLGLPRWRILCFHLLPGIYRELFAFLGSKASNVTLQYAGLAFIGLGTDITCPDWGTLLYQYRVYLIKYPRLVIYPILCICCLSIFFYVMFDKSRSKEEEMTIYD